MCIERSIWEEHPLLPPRGVAEWVACLSIHTHTHPHTHTPTHTHSYTRKRSFFRVRSIFVPVVFCFPQRILSLNPPHRPPFPIPHSIHLPSFHFPSHSLLCLPSSFHCVAFAVPEMCFGEFYSLGLFISAMCKLFLSAQRLFIQGVAAPRYCKCNMKLESTYLQVDFGYIIVYTINYL